ncbi:protein GID8 homolog [Musa acuminata AAA Group]|uniref:protein GID8 homolog n=1 Tax=Musa acuminata AAA Group TaxID=214697 RepID=UPI0008A0EBA1|nr:PREDICTED: glucose-induced degradation protein 8 homolog [Musa acuminata subsp. malaccensis]
MDAAGPSSKRVIMYRAWERRLEDVRIRDADVNKLVMNYLVTEGYAEAAEKFQIESGTEPDIDLATVFERRAVLRAVESFYLKETIEKLNRLDPMILVMNRQIDFRLQHQRMIEMIRAGEMEMALLYAVDEILPGIQNNIDFLKEFIRTTTLFPLLGPSQRLKLVSQVNAAILTSQNHEKEPKLPILLKMLICIQNELDENAAFPLVCDLMTTELPDTACPYHLSF